MKITQTGVGSTPPVRVYGNHGGYVMAQSVASDGVTEYKLELRQAPDAPWRNAGSLYGLSWPVTGDQDASFYEGKEARLTITSGTGTVTVYIADGRT
jgi:hypothetical protein